MEQENHCFGMFGHFELMSAPGSQSVTSRLETSRYRDFSQFFESIGLGLENFGLEKSLGIGLDEVFWSRHSVVRTLCYEDFTGNDNINE